VPHVIHYGLHFDLKDDASWDFDKHYYYGFDPLKCPPWPSWEGYTTPMLRNLVGDALSKARLGPPPKPAVAHPSEGIFPPPPHPDRLGLISPNQSPIDRYRDLLSIFTVAQMNAAICEFHTWTCPWSEQLQAVCGDAWELYLDVRDVVDELESRWSCMDHRDDCRGWANSGECEKMPAYMSDHCAVSCKKCTPRPISKFVGRPRRSLKYAGAPTKKTNPGQGKGGSKTNEDDGGAVAAAGSTSAAEAQGPSQLSFASLVKRCSDAFEPPLDHTSLGLCVRAAGLSLAYTRPDSLIFLLDDDGDHRNDIDGGARTFLVIGVLALPTIALFSARICWKHGLLNWLSSRCGQGFKRASFGRIE
jgi:hypothetical protein